MLEHGMTNTQYRRFVSPSAANRLLLTSLIVKERKLDYLAAFWRRRLPDLVPIVQMAKIIASFFFGKLQKKSTERRKSLFLKAFRLQKNFGVSPIVSSAVAGIA